MNIARAFVFIETVGSAVHIGMAWMEHATWDVEQALQVEAKPHALTVSFSSN